MLLECPKKALDSQKMKKGAASGRCENPEPSLRPNWWRHRKISPGFRDGVPQVAIN